MIARRRDGSSRGIIGLCEASQSFYECRSGTHWLPDPFPDCDASGRTASRARGRGSRAQARYRSASPRVRDAQRAADAVAAAATPSLPAARRRCRENTPSSPEIMPDRGHSDSGVMLLETKSDSLTPDSSELVTYGRSSEALDQQRKARQPSTSRQSDHAESSRGSIQVGLRAP